MQWERPEMTVISLACEIGSYANAELEAPMKRDEAWKVVRGGVSDRNSKEALK